MTEFDLIARIRARASAHARGDVLLGIGDDAALLRVTPGSDLVVAMDALNAGVHFPEDTPAAAIGWKSLAVNLSDLAAMGATPAWCTLSLSLPEASTTWFDAFFDGFLVLAAQHDVALIGGDTTRGSLSICVTAHGLVPAGTALRRGGAQVGDDIWVTGTLGDAAGALAQWRSGTGIDNALRSHLDRPQPRVGFGSALRGLATACIDVSDGLLADLGHVCMASGCGAVVDIDSLPVSAALTGAFDGDDVRRLAATGGDDYELCFTAPPIVRGRLEQAAAAGDIAIHLIGTVCTGADVSAQRRDGSPWRYQLSGYAHFSRDAGGAD